MARRFQFSLGRLMGSVSLACVSLWLLRYPNTIAIFWFPFTVGAAIGQLFGRPLFGIVAVAGLLYAAFLVLLTLAAISEGRASLMAPLIGAGAVVGCLTVLSIVRRYNGRRERVENE